MLKAVQYTFLGCAAFGGIYYGRMYVDVLAAERAVKTIDREVKKTETERENLKHEITSSRKASSELEAKGTAALQVQTEINGRIEETKGLLSRLNQELIKSKTDFEALRLKIKETNNRTDRLRSVDAEKQQFLETARGRKDEAMLKVMAARKAMELDQLPLIGSYVKGPGQK